MKKRIYMLTGNDIWILAEAYVADTLAAEELDALKNRLAEDQQFAIEFNEHVNILRSMDGAGKQMRFKSMLADIQNNRAKVEVKQPRTISLKTYYLRTAGIAAAMALFTSLTTYWVIQHNTSRIASEYSLLRRDLEKYKRSQNQLINNLKEQQNRPVAEARYTGTGFALTNDGYLVTNYHVIDGADSVYIQNKEGRYLKATTVGFDQATDVAILKVEDDNFRFGKTEVPYTFAANRRKLGTKIYTLGFPQDDIVYNEGYVSSKNGYNGDSSQYQLEVPAYPGQSGAPILDASGSVLAMITGKESGSEGTTYAVNAKAVMQVVRNLPKEENVRLPKANKMAHLTLEQQIEKMESYTCSIKVYKK